MTDPVSICLDIQNSPDMVDLVQAVSDQARRSAELDDDALHCIHVSVRESVVNAITDGNHDDAGKLVHVSLVSARHQAFTTGY